MADWKKIILSGSDATLASVTASAGVNIGTSVTVGTAASDGVAGDRVVTVDASGNFRSLAQGSVAGLNTEYDAGDGLNLGGAGNLTFSVVPAEITHSHLFGWLADEHINWSASAAGYEIHSSNYSDTTYTGGPGITIDAAGAVSTSANQGHVTAVGSLTAGSISEGFGNIYTTGFISASTVTASYLTIYGSVRSYGDALIEGGATIPGDLSASVVSITGSLTVDGDLTFNGATFEDISSGIITGSTEWGLLDGTSNHYFSGSVTASGGVSASSFTGDGSGLTGILGSGITTEALTAGNGLNNTNNVYDGTATKTFSVKPQGSTIGVTAQGIRVANNTIGSLHLQAGAVTHDKMGVGAVLSEHLSADFITGLTPTVYTSLDANDAFLIASGSTGPNQFKHTTIADITNYVSSSLNFSTEVGTVTGVTMVSNVQGIEITVAGSTAVPTITLSGNVEINNDNFPAAGVTTATALSIANGGTGQITAKDAANALLNTTLGSLTFGTGGDTITIGGDLIVNGNLTSITSTDLEITDRYVLIGSGSSTGDIGIQFGEASSQGNMLVWEDNYSGSDGRFGVNRDNTSAMWNTGGTLNVDCDYHIATVFAGTSEDAATAKQNHNGNIRLDGSGNAYIWVE